MEALCKADYDYELCDDVIVIYDLDQGGRSVTTDIRNVLADVWEGLGGTFGDRKVIYRDSMKIFDGIDFDERGRFVRFYPLQETVLERALNKVRGVVLLDE